MTAKLKGHIEGDISYSPDVDYSSVESIGGSLHCGSTTLPDHLGKLKTNDPDAPRRAASDLQKSFLKLGFLIADGMLSKIVAQRKTGSMVVWKVVTCGHQKHSYVIEKNGLYSHGKTFKEARASFIYKITDRDTTPYKTWSLSTVISAADAIASYRAITGACELGTRYFCETHGIDLSAKYTPKKIIAITEGAYGNNQYREFFALPETTHGSR